jgi:Putative peptidoglycan binding domain
MVPYVIRQGDHLTKLAARLGFDADEVWNDDANADLRKLRTDPHVLCAGDVLYVPEAKPPKWLSLQVGSVNRLVATVPKVKISLTLAQGGKAIANEDCVVHGLPPPNEFTTDGAGALSFDAPVDVEFVTLEFPSLSLVRRMRIGHLDPVTEPSGVLQRLTNMGHVAPAALAAGGDQALSQALRAFQSAQGLTVTGELDNATRKQLEDTHGC